MKKKKHEILKLYNVFDKCEQGKKHTFISSFFLNERKKSEQPKKMGKKSRSNDGSVLRNGAFVRC